MNDQHHHTARDPYADWPLRDRLNKLWGVPYDSAEMALVDALTAAASGGTTPAGPADRNGLIAHLRATGWHLARSGRSAELWRHPDGRDVIVHLELTPDSWEWPGTLARAGIPTGPAGPAVTTAAAPNGDRGEHTIRVIDYNGDLETLEEITVIFGFDGPAERDAAIAELSALPGMRGSYDLEPSTIPHTAADMRCHHTRLAGITNADQFGDALYDGDAHLPA